MKTFDELKQVISLIELANANGYALDNKAGYKWPLLRHASGDKIIIVDTGKTTQGYFNPHDDRDKGSLIDFVKHRLGIIFPKDNTKSEWENVSVVLHSYLKIPLEIRSSWQTQSTIRNIAMIKNQPFSKAGLQPLTDISYLQSRGISKETLNDALFSGRIYNHPASSYKNNIGFVYTDERDDITGIEVRNANCRLFIKGSERSVSIWHSNIPALLNTVLFFESPIDALSHYQLAPNSNALYIAFGGQLADGQIKTATHIVDNTSKANSVSMISCFDNDSSGEKFTQKLQKHFAIVERELPAMSKDFNEMLQMKSGIQIKKIYRMGY